MSQFSRPQPRPNPGCTSAALSPTIKFRGFTSVHPPPKIPAGFFSSLLKACTSSPKAEMSPSLLPAAGGAAPGPERRGARVDAHKGPPLPRRGRKPKQAARGKLGADKRRRRRTGGPDIRPLRRPAPQTGELRSALPASPLPEARGAGGPTSTSRASSSAATPPSRRPMAPARTVRSLAAPRAQGRSAPRDEQADTGDTSLRRQKDARQTGGAPGCARPPSPRAPDPPHGRALGLRACKVCGARCGTR